MVCAQYREHVFIAKMSHSAIFFICYMNLYYAALG